jgi:glycerol-3-phosphate dehydrogenase subunit B
MRVARRAQIPESKMQSNRYDVVVVGSGIAGLTAAAIAARQNRTVALIATGPGALALSHGWLKAEQIGPPSAATDQSEAIAFFCELARLAGYPLAGDIAHPRSLPTHLGSYESVAFAPQRLWNAALPGADSTAIVGIRGLSSFDENFMADRLNERVRLARSRRSYAARQITFSRNFGIPATALQIAVCFDRDADFRSELIDTLRSAASGFERILLPGILGLHSSEQQIVQLEQELGCSVCEVPTLPPCIPGLRLFHRLESYLHSVGVELFRGYPVKSLHLRDGLCAGLDIAAPGHGITLHGHSVVLATGRRSAQIMGEASAGCDEQMRPLSSTGAVMAQNLYFAGSMPANRTGNNGDMMKILGGYRAGTFAATTRGAYAS